MASKVVGVVTSVFLGLPLTAYALLLAGNAVSAWRIQRLLDNLEEILVGDPSARLLSTIEGCVIQPSESEYLCQVYHYPLQFEWLDAVFWKLPDAVTRADRLRHLGLREQYLGVAATIDHQRGQSITVL